MRQLKFRIYDKGRKQWVHDTAHAISLFGEYIIMGENNLDAMQLTGLHDKNGQEIYEGDIIQVHYPGTWAGQVVYSPPRWGIYSHKSELTHDFLMPNNNIEVVGNIYETPELLTK